MCSFRLIEITCLIASFGQDHRDSFPFLSGEYKLSFRLFLLDNASIPHRRNVHKAVDSCASLRTFLVRNSILSFIFVKNILLTNSTRHSEFRYLNRNRSFPLRASVIRRPQECLFALHDVMVYNIDPLVVVCSVPIVQTTPCCRIPSLRSDGQRAR